MPAVIADYQPILKKAAKQVPAADPAWANSPENVMRALYDVGFLGLTHTRSGTCWYSYQRKFEDALRTTVPNRAVCVHPAFHSYLQIESV
jgi:hypothetical protein